MTSLPDADEITSSSSPSPPPPHLKPKEEEMEEGVVENSSLKVNPATEMKQQKPSAASSRLMITHMVRTLSFTFTRTHRIHALPPHHTLLGT